MANLTVTDTQLNKMTQSIRGAINEKYGSMREAFKAIDTDRSGKLSRREIMRAVASFQLNIPREHLLQLMQLSDTNGDDEIDFDEFVAGLKQFDLSDAMKRFQAALVGGEPLPEGGAPPMTKAPPMPPPPPAAHMYVESPRQRPGSARRYGESGGPQSQWGLGQKAGPPPGASPLAGIFRGDHTMRPPSSAPRSRPASARAANFGAVARENAKLRQQVQELAARAEVYSPRHTSDRVPPSPRSPRAQSASPRGRAPGVRRDQANMATAGLSSDEMVREAQIRLYHNRQRAQLKDHLRAMTGRGSTKVGTDQLMLAAKLAKLPLPEQMLFASPYADQYTLSRDGAGAAQEVDWRRFVSAIDHPKLGAKPDQALQNYLDRMQAKKDAKEAAERKRREAAKVAQARKEAAAAPKITGPPVKEAELLKAHGKIREHFSTRFNDVRRGFRLLDEDKSGTLTRQEMRSVLMMFNLDIEARLIEKLIDFADQDGDGTIDYAEFARVMTAEDLKSYDLSKLGLVKEVKVFRKGPPVLRPGVTAAEIRDAQQTIKSRINTKYGDKLSRCFREIDGDGSGKADRAEVLRLIKIYAPSSRDEVLENVVDFGDYDGEGEVSFAEFARVVTTDDILNMKKTLSAVEVKTNKYGEVEEAVDHRREIDKQWEAERLKQWDAFANPDN